MSEALKAIREKLGLGEEVRLLRPHEVFITKGTEVYVQTLVPIETFSLAGAQMKLAVREVALAGVVAHVRGDAPTAEACTKIGVWIVPSDPDAAVKLFDNLTIKAAQCAECGQIEVGPLSVESIKFVIQRP